MTTAKVVVLGLNRTGTKLASYVISTALGLRRVCLEPFTWAGGLDTARPGAWTIQLQQRSPSASGAREDRRLAVLSRADEGSAWLENVLRRQGWDVVKFVEIGRCALYRRTCPEAAVVGLIRQPAPLLASLNGAEVPRGVVARQWRSLVSERAAADPLPEAEEVLPRSLADCARAYVTLYGALARAMPADGLRLSFEELAGGGLEWLQPLAERLGVRVETLGQIPLIGVSTRAALSEDQESYVESRLLPTYREFLGRNAG